MTFSAFDHPILGAPLGDAEAAAIRQGLRFVEPGAAGPRASR
ncbi:MAG: hypothetical protein ABSA66_10520 [Roseiarcus sp.]|jgi:hypothetical protein